MEMERLLRSRGAQCLLVLFLLSAHSPAQKVKVEHDASVDFSKPKTYAWVKGTPAKDPHLDQYIMAAIDHDLKEKGLTKADAPAADLLITYHAARDGQINATKIDETIVAMSMGFPSGTTVMQSKPVGTNTRLIQKGTLALEMYDRAHPRPIWSATSTVKIKERRNEALDQLDKIITRMTNAYPPGRP